MKKEDALKYTVSEETILHKNGVEYSTFTAIVEGSKIECRLFHSLVNKRLTDETFLEYQIRRQHAKQYVKSKKRMIWYSKNPNTVSDYKMTNALLQMAAQTKKGEDNTPNKDLLRKGLENVKVTEELAYKTNLGTYDKTKVEEFINSQESKQ